ncbi:MAG: hypothetical protein FJ276_18010 [Planctomycetes bacterium]|nr:hypothetical protein [Planctomycetota bacterium]
MLGILLSWFLSAVGCDTRSGNLGRAVDGVRRLQPEIDERNREIERLANPHERKVDEGKLDEGKVDG